MAASKKSSSSKTKSSTKQPIRETKENKKKEGWGFEEAGFGVVLIAFALPMIWMNERKDVKIYKVISRGKSEVVEADCEDP